MKRDFSHFHKPIFTVITKNFNYATFRMELFREFCLGKMQNKDIFKFCLLVINLTEPHAPMKERCVSKNFYEEEYSNGHNGSYASS